MGEPCDALAGFEDASEAYFSSIAYTTIGCEHEVWIDADYDMPMHCERCGFEKGEPLEPETDIETEGTESDEVESDETEPEETNTETETETKTEETESEENTETESVGAVFSDEVERVDDVALGFTHFFAVGIKDETVEVNFFERDAACDVESHHNHTGDPSEENISASLHDVKRVIRIEIILGPVGTNDRPVRT